MRVFIVSPSQEILWGLYWGLLFLTKSAESTEFWQAILFLATHHRLVWNLWYFQGKAAMVRLILLQTNEEGHHLSWKRSAWLEWARKKLRLLYRRQRQAQFWKFVLFEVISICWCDLALGRVNNYMNILLRSDALHRAWLLILEPTKLHIPSYSV